MSISTEQLLSLFTKTHDDLQKIGAEIKQLAAAKNDLDKVFFDSADWRLMLNVRAEGGPTVPERHRDWHDVSLYLSGGNTISAGGKLSGAEETSAGEERGGNLTGGEEYELKAGDLFVVPAGIPHQNNFLPGTVFGIIKVLAGGEEKSLIKALVADWKQVTQIAHHVSIP